MCGVTGWIDFQGNIAKETETIKRMTETLSKCGPDVTNIYLDTHIGFGHKRLVVVDAKGGVHPMVRKK